MIREPSHRSAWYSLSVLVIVTLFSFVDRQVLALLTDQVARSLRLRDAQIGLIQGLGSATFAMLATYPLGWLTDRYDRRFVLSGCILIWSLGTAACGFAQGFWSLFFAVIAISAGEAGLPALAYSAIPDLFAGKRRLLANQVFYIAMILSAAVGIGFGGAADFALDSIKKSLPVAFAGLESWRMVFLLVAAPAPILIGLVAATGLGVRPQASLRPAASPRTVGEPKGNLQTYFRVHWRTTVLVVSALSLYGLPFVAILTWTPAALTRLFAVSPGQNGLGLALSLGIGCILGVGLAGWLMRLLRPKLGDRAPLRIACMTLLVSLPLAVLYALVTTAWQSFMIVGALMTSGTLIGSLLPGILQSMAPPELRGRIVAIYYIVSVLSGAIGVTLVGPFSDLSPGDHRALLIGVAALLTVAWSLGALLMRLSEAPFERLVTAIGDVNH